MQGKLQLLKKLSQTNSHFLFHTHTFHHLLCIYLLVYYLPKHNLFLYNLQLNFLEYVLFLYHLLLHLLHIQYYLLKFLFVGILQLVLRISLYNKSGTYLILLFIFLIIKASSTPNIKTTTINSRLPSIF